MSKLSTLIALVFLLISPGFSQQKILESALIQAESNGFSGVILVAEDGKILLEKAIGKRSFEQNILLFPSDIFELASVSKQFTAMMVMMCREKKCFLSMIRWKSTWISLTKALLSAIY